MDLIKRGIDALSQVKIFAFLFLLGFWIASIGYDGIRHDNILYAAQAYERLHPHTFNADVFFAYGSQNDYSIFGSFFAVLIKWLGLGAANFVCVLVLQIALFSVTFALFNRLLDKTSAFVAIAFLAALPRNYGAFLSLFENFLTGRLIAELCVLLGLFWAMGGRKWLALGAIAVGFVFHPLQTLPALAVLYLLEMAKLQRKWLWLGVVPAGCFLGAALILLDYSPFHSLATTYDPEWLKIVKNANFVFLANWPLKNWTPLAFDLAVLAAVVRSKSVSPQLLQIMVAATAVTIIAYIVSLTFGDLLHNVLIVSMQLWRSQWVLHLFAFGCLGDLCVRHWRSSGSLRLGLLILILGVVSQNYLGGVLAIGLATLVLWFQPSITSSFARICSYSLAAFIVAVFVSDYTTFLLAVEQYHFANTLQTYASPPQIVLAIALLFCIAAGRWGHWRGVLYGVVFLQLLTGGWLWDKRDEWHRLIEAPALDNPIVRAIDGKGEVFWPDQLLAVWFLLQRPSYYTDYQGAGVLFNRETAIEFKRHQDAVKIIEFQTQVCDAFRALSGANDCHADVEAYTELCREAQNLDYFVTDTSIGIPDKAVWSPLVAGRREHWYLYSCKSVI